MATRQHRPQRQHPSPILMECEAGVPTYDMLENRDVTRPYDVEEALEDLMYNLTSDYFLRWEAAISEEREIPLTPQQEQVLDELVSFDEPGDDERILYIDGMERPVEPWYETARKIVAHLVETSPFDTAAITSAVMGEVWPEFLEIFDTHTRYLSLPEDCQSPRDIFPADVLHQLNLQYCLDCLGGLGQLPTQTLKNPEQQDRVTGFIEGLQAEKEMVRYFNFTLEGLLAHITMPANDEQIFLTMMRKHLNLPSDTVPLFSFLFPGAE